MTGEESRWRPLHRAEPRAGRGEGDAPEGPGRLTPADTYTRCMTMPTKATEEESVLHLEEAAAAADEWASRDDQFAANEDEAAAARDAADGRRDQDLAQHEQESMASRRFAGDSEVDYAAEAMTSRLLRIAGTASRRVTRGMRSAAATARRRAGEKRAAASSMRTNAADRRRR